VTFKFKAVFLYYLLEGLVEIGREWIVGKFEITPSVGFRLLVIEGHVLERSILEELFLDRRSEVKEMLCSWNCR